MIYSLIQLAQRRGTVRVQRRAVNGGYEYEVAHLDGRYDHDQAIDYTTIPYVEGEDVRDTKSRAIAAVRMLGYWPELRAEIAQDRLITLGGYGAGKTAQFRDELARHTDSGIILPGAP